MKTVDELVAQLHKPIYLLQMNRTNSAAGSEQRARKARKEIDKLVREYVASQWL